LQVVSCVPQVTAPRQEVALSAGSIPDVVKHEPHRRLIPRACQKRKGVMKLPGYGRQDSFGGPVCVLCLRLARRARPTWGTYTDCTSRWVGRAP
jgi:hypothetical protein